MGGEHNPKKCQIRSDDKDGVGDQTHMALPGAIHPSGLGFLKGSNNYVLPLGETTTYEYDKSIIQMLYE